MGDEPYGGAIPDPNGVPDPRRSSERVPAAAPTLPPLRNPAPPPGRWSGTNPLEPSDPRRVGGYEVLAQLGIGGMGTVYLARARDDELVAIKLVHPHLASDSEFRARFASEAQAGQRVPPFCSARVLGRGEYEGRPYLVTEYIDGVPLSQFVAEDGPLGLPDLHALALGTAAGLAAIHKVGLVHRDIKPSNIILTLGGVRIIDFGIARALDDTFDYTRSGVVMGSLGWAAPEQLGGEPPSPAMDVFGWGCVIGYAATGEHPFGGNDLNTRAWRVLHADPDVRGVPAPLRDLVASALRRSPEQRPNTRDLLLALVGAVGTDPPVPHPTAPRRPRRAAGALAAAVPLALAIVIGAAGGSELGDTFGPGDDPSLYPDGGKVSTTPSAPRRVPSGARTSAGGGGAASGRISGASAPGSTGASPPVDAGSTGAAGRDNSSPAPTMTKPTKPPKPTKSKNPRDLNPT